MQAREALAEAYEAQGRDGSARRMAAREHCSCATGMRRQSPSRSGRWPELFGKYRQYDQSSVPVPALVCLTKADPRERAFYESNARGAIPWPSPF